MTKLFTLTTLEKFLTDYLLWSLNSLLNYYKKSKTDWFLGSLGEMMLMYSNLQGVGGFAAGAYWSSSENDATTAWYQTFDSGRQLYSGKTSVYYVRPVRAF